ncbi:MAG: MCE family protein [Saprospiraceae bacterium]|nr:MCE family protein [Saprospiraceae bacterium]
MKISNEVKIGILATVTIVSAIWGYKFLKGENLLDRSLTINADFMDAQQINKSAPVFFRGVEVGTVKEIIFRPDNGTKATLVLTIKQNPGVPKNAVAVLFSNGVLSGKAVNLDFEKTCTGGDCAQNGDFIAGRTMKALESMIGNPADLDPYVGKVTNGMKVIFDTLGYQLNQPDNELGKSMRDIQATLVSLRKTTALLNQMMAASASSLNSTIKNVDGITGNLNANNGKINQLLDNVNSATSQANTLVKGIDISKINAATEGAGQSVEELKKTLAQTTKSLTELTTTLQKVNSGSGTIGQFATNDSVYHSLNYTLLQTQSLMQDLRLNPKRYLNLNPFRKYKPYVVPNKDPLMDTLQMRYNASQKKQ